MFMCTCMCSGTVKANAAWTKMSSSSRVHIIHTINKLNIPHSLPPRPPGNEDAVPARLGVRVSKLHVL